MMEQVAERQAGQRDGHTGRSWRAYGQVIHAAEGLKSAGIAGLVIVRIPEFLHHGKPSGRIHQI